MLTTITMPCPACGDTSGVLYDDPRAEHLWITARYQCGFDAQHIFPVRITLGEETPDITIRTGPCLAPVRPILAGSPGREDSL